MAQRVATPTSCHDVAACVLATIYARHQVLGGHILAHGPMAVEANPALRAAVREYRDKFVAHLDDVRVMNVPAMQPLLDSAIFLYDTLCTNEPTVFHLTGLQPDAKEFYEQRFAKALAEYRRAERQQVT
ncbi:hypothetical protein V9L20_12540 [Variovorax sp. CCNWLW225]|uniref:hypothetical protein n=1 Tax=Variovorax sp. CCNWLW225 TaxID=3127462 RepID=UPI0030786CDD